MVRNINMMHLQGRGGGGMGARALAHSAPCVQVPLPSTMSNGPIHSQTQCIKVVISATGYKLHMSSLKDPSHRCALQWRSVWQAKNSGQRSGQNSRHYVFLRNTWFASAISIMRREAVGKNRKWVHKILTATFGRVLGWYRVLIYSYIRGVKVGSSGE